MALTNIQFGRTYFSFVRTFWKYISPSGTVETMIRLKRCLDQSWPFLVTIVETETFLSLCQNLCLWICKVCALCLTNIEIVSKSKVMNFGSTLWQYVVLLWRFQYIFPKERCILWKSLCFIHYHVFTQDNSVKVVF